MVCFLFAYQNFSEMSFVFMLRREQSRKLPLWEKKNHICCPDVLTKNTRYLTTIFRHQSFHQRRSPKSLAPSLEQRISFFCACLLCWMALVLDFLSRSYILINKHELFSKWRGRSFQWAQEEMYSALSSWAYRSAKSQTNPIVIQRKSFISSSYNKKWPAGIMIVVWFPTFLDPAKLQAAKFLL